MRGLDPAVLLGIAPDAQRADLIEHETGAARDQFGKSLGLVAAQMRNRVVCCHGSGKVRNDDAAISP